MTEHEQRLDLTAAQIERLTAEAFAELMRRLRAGEDPQPAIQAIMQTWEPAYREVLAAAFSDTLGRLVGADELRDYPIGDMRLSARLYQQAEATTAVVREIVRRHAAGFQEARTLTLQLYEGYGFRKGEPLQMSPRNPRLPKYLRREILTDPGLAGQMARHFTRVQAATLKTRALRAAYLEAIDAMEQGHGAQVLQRKLDVAFQERMRYHANRIAQTELHRAHVDRQADEIMADESVEVVKWVMSATHPHLDICDLFARQDKYGLGPGCYPKALAPKPPAHPFCRCGLHSRRLLKAKDARENLASERQFLARMMREEGVSKAARVIGSRAKLAVALSQAPIEAVINLHRPAPYRLGRVGDNGRMDSVDSVKVFGFEVHGNVERAARVRAAFDAISGTHDLSLPPIPVRFEKMMPGGKFRFDHTTRAPVDLVISKNNPQIELTAAHEYGHYLHFSGMPPPGSFNVADASFDRFVSAAMGSRQVREIQRRIHEAGGYGGYLLEPREIWARAYAQYVAIKSGNVAMLGQIETRLRSKGLQSLENWRDDDFAAILSSVDEVLRTHGVLK